MKKEVIFSDKTARPAAPYSPAVKIGNIVYTSGVVPFDADGNIVGVGDIKAQTRQVLESIKTLLAEAGATMDDVIKVLVFLTDMSNFKDMNQVYSEYFPSDRPARSCVQVGLARKEFLVEIEALAVL